MQEKHENVQLYIQTTSSQLLSRTSNSIRYRAKLSVREDTHCNTQFYLQLVYKSHEIEIMTFIVLVVIAGNKNPATQNFFIHFSIENLIANISF